jgi:hypothetical protein
MKQPAGGEAKQAEGGALPHKPPAKSVRFTEQSKSHRVHAAQSTASAPKVGRCSRGNDGGAATLANHSNVNQLADEREKAGIERTFPLEEVSSEALNAEGHGLLPSWRLQLKMPTVNW